MKERKSIYRQHTGRRIKSPLLKSPIMAYLQTKSVSNGLCTALLGSLSVSRVLTPTLDVIYAMT